MTTAVTVAVLAVAIASASYLAVGVRWPQLGAFPRPVTRWLENTPWPSLRMPRIRRPRLAKQGRHHADGLGLVFDPLQGRLRHAETGPIPRVRETLP